MNDEGKTRVRTDSFSQVVSRQIGCKQLPDPNGRFLFLVFFAAKKRVRRRVQVPSVINQSAQGMSCAECPVVFLCICSTTFACRCLLLKNQRAQQPERGQQPCPKSPHSRGPRLWTKSGVPPSLFCAHVQQRWHAWGSDHQSDLIEFLVCGVLVTPFCLFLLWCMGFVFLGSSAEHCKAIFVKKKEISGRMCAGY